MNLGGELICVALVSKCIQCTCWTVRWSVCALERSCDRGSTRPPPSASKAHLFQICTSCMHWRRLRWCDGTEWEWMEWDGMRCGWKAGKGDLCICDCRECFMVLNVADRTGLEPSPGTRTSLQVTSKSGQCCQNDVTHTAYWAYIARPSRCNTCVLFCFIFLFCTFSSFLAITKDVNTKQNDIERLNHYVLTICNRHILDVEARTPADPTVFVKENCLHSFVNASHICMCAFVHSQMCMFNTSMKKKCPIKLTI